MKKRVLSVILALFFTMAVSVNTVFADYYSSRITLVEGMKGSEVTNLQNDLKRLGYFDFGSTGYFGNLTEQAVKEYQRDNYLSIDGMVGHFTAKEIKVDKALQTSRQYLGVPYVWGGASPSGFDCSGFTHYVFLKNNVVIPRESSSQYSAGIAVSKSQLRQGDLVFFTTYKPGPSHVGIYLGSGKFIHASSGAGKVIISELNNTYYSQHYIGARRVVQ